MPRPQHLGIDFDNTIVCYDALFGKLARERKLLPRSATGSKQQIRDALRAANREDEWTELQAVAYGERILEATPAPGVLTFLERAHNAGIPMSIVSHKTRAPYAGPPVALREAARGWLQHYEVLDRIRTGLTLERVWFETTKEAKADRIAQIGCSHFIDDLPEFLDAPFFPAIVEPLLYAPRPESVRSVAVLPAFGDWLNLDPVSLRERTPTS
ncbi:MAG: haloacid dehalogenase-like hydrolase [Planctomycetota bacterium]